MMTMNMVVVRWTNKGKQLKCQEFKLCTVTKISLSPSTISMSLSSSSSSSPTWRMGLPKPGPPIRRTLSLIGARMATAWVTARPVTRLAETKTVITISSPYHHHIITILSPYHHHIITISSPYHHHVVAKNIMMVCSIVLYHQEIDSFRMRTERTC